MPLIQAEYHSKLLRKATGMNILLPTRPSPTGDGRYPVLYLLHGLSDNHTIWCRNTAIERYALDYPLIIVMPDGDRGFYTDGLNAPAHESHIVVDVIEFVERWLPVIPSREGRTIAGLSMGGYGALKLALKFPQLFVAASSHSGCLRVGEVLKRYADTPDIAAERRAIFGKAPENGPEDIFAVVKALMDGKSDRPALRFDCGVDDFLIEENRDFHRHLDELGYVHQYTEHPGVHNWEYWDRHVPESLAFVAGHLGISGN